MPPWAIELLDFIDAIELRSRPDAAERGRLEYGPLLHRVPRKFKSNAERLGRRALPESPANMDYQA